MPRHMTDELRRTLPQPHHSSAARLEAELRASWWQRKHPPTSRKTPTHRTTK